MTRRFKYYKNKTMPENYKTFLQFNKSHKYPGI